MEGASIFVGKWESEDLWGEEREKICMEKVPKIFFIEVTKAKKGNWAAALLLQFYSILH